MIHRLAHWLRFSPSPLARLLFEIGLLVGLYDDAPHG
jgi:hypothetical protein